MEILYASYCAIDVHACMLVARLIKDSNKEVRTFSTITDDLLLLLDWLSQQGCTHVAIESAGVYWKSVFNVLGGAVEIIVTNTRDVRGFNARKIDGIDAEWLADLLRHGLLKRSFIPPLVIRELREFTCSHASLIRKRVAPANRNQKLMKSGNIKLTTVASDELGVSGNVSSTF